MYFIIESEPDEIQKRLDKTAELLSDLQKTQNERLSLKPPPHLASISGPGESEKQIGRNICVILSRLINNGLQATCISLLSVTPSLADFYFFWLDICWIHIKTWTLVIINLFSSFCKTSFVLITDLYLLWYPWISLGKCNYYLLTDSI